MTLQDEIRRRRELGLPELTPAEQREFQQNLDDTAARDLREAGRGTVRTTMKGTRVTEGPYKGLTRPQMEQAIITGTMPKGKYQPGAMGRMTGSLTGDSLPARPRLSPPSVSAAPTPAPATPPSRPVDPTLVEPRGFANSGAAPTARPSPAAPSAGIARAITDNRDMGIVARDANGVQFDNGARIMPGANGSKSLASPYGSGSVQFLPPGQKASDPRLAAEIAAIKGRQAQGIYAPKAPMVASAPTPAPSPAPVAAAPTPPKPALKPPPAPTDKLTPLIESTQAMITQARTPDVMKPEWRAAQIAAAQPAGAAPLKPYTQELATMFPKTPAVAAPAPAQSAAPQPPTIAPPAPAAVPNPAAAAGVPSITWSQVGKALNPNNPNAWINDPLGMRKKSPTTQAATPAPRPARTLQPPQLVMSR